MKRLILAAALAATTGCSGLGGKPNSYEYAFHALNAVDMGQTINIAKRPDCWREVGFPTEYLVGNHPSESEVYATILLYSVGYHYANRWLDKKVDKAFATDDPNRGIWYVGRAVFNVGWIFAKADTVIDNHDQGLRPWGDGC
jgi:hypothetical protein